MDFLDVEKASLFFMCAGTPFALLFAARNPARTTGHLLGISSWVSPADFDGAGALYRLATRLPSRFVSRLAGSLFASGPRALRSLPAETVPGILEGKLSEPERA